MHFPGTRGVTGIECLTLASFLLGATNCFGQAAGMALLVPAYFSPEPSGPWADLARAASRVPLVAILNPINGPGTAVNADYLRAVRAVRSAGGQVIGYVYTSYGDRPLAQVKLDLDRYDQFYPMDGYFIDEMSNEAWVVRYDYYEEIYRYAKAKDARRLVVGNPGTNTEEAYLKRPTVDGLVIFENQSGYGQFSPARWVANYPACQFANLTYQVPNAATMTNYVDLAASRNAGFIYVTDDQGANPWDRLPSYWSEEVGYVESLNRQAASLGPAQLSITSGPDATLLVNIHGVAGRLVVESSTDLHSWLPVATNLPLCGDFTLLITNRVGTAASYFRSRQ